MMLSDADETLPILIRVPMNGRRLANRCIVGYLIFGQFGLSPNHARGVQPKSITITCDAGNFQYAVRSCFCGRVEDDELAVSKERCLGGRMRNNNKNKDAGECFRAFHFFRKWLKWRFF